MIIVDKSKSTKFCLFQPVLIEKAGYPSETHMVTTDDGYILTMHRIPYSKDDPDSYKNGEVNVTRPVVFVQHGLLCSSADFVLSDPPKALGIYILEYSKKDIEY